MPAAKPREELQPIFDLLNSTLMQETVLSESKLLPDSVQIVQCALRHDYLALFPQLDHCGIEVFLNMLVIFG